MRRLSCLFGKTVGVDEDIKEVVRVDEIEREYMKDFIVVAWEK